MPIINAIPYPRLHNGVVVHGPEDFPAGQPPADLVAAYGGAADVEPEPEPEGVNINMASADELRTIKGVGKATAGDIVSERLEGEFISLADCADRVGGVSLRQLEAAGAWV